MALPAFHTYGIFTGLYVPIAYLVTAVVYAPRTVHDPLAQPVIPTSDNIIDCLKQVPCNTLMTVPTPLEQMATSEEAIAILKKLDSVVRAISFNLAIRSLSPVLWWWSSTSQDRREVVGFWSPTRQWLWRHRIWNPRGRCQQARYC